MRISLTEEVESASRNWDTEGKQPHYYHSFFQLAHDKYRES